MGCAYSPFVASSMKETLLEMLENHPEIFDRPTKYPEGREQCLKLRKEKEHEQ